MNRLHILLLSMSILSLLAACCSCHRAVKPHRPLVALSYSDGSQMEVYPAISFDVRQDSTGSITAIVFDPRAYSFYRYRITDATLMQRLADVIMEHRMYRYRSSYVNPHVLDGDHWSFHATFRDSTSTIDTYDADHISSGGSNAYPRGDGLKAIHRVLQEAMQSAELLYLCDEEGTPIAEPVDPVMEAE